MRLQVYKSSVFFITVLISLNVTAMSLSEFSEVYLQNSLVVEQAKLAIHESKERHKEARASIFPSVTANLSKITQNLPVGIPAFIPEYKAEVSLSQPLYMGGRIWRGITLKEQAVDLSELGYQEAERKLLLGALMKATTLAFKSKEIAEVKYSLDAQKNFSELTKRKLKRGNAKGYEFKQTLADLYSYRARIEGLKAQKENLSKELLIEINQPHAKAIDIKLPPAPNKLPIPLKQAMNNAVKTRSDVRLAAVQLELARTNKKFEMGSHLPSVSVGASLGYQGYNTGTLFDSASQYDTVSINVSVPLFSGLSSLNARRAGEHNVMAAEKNYQDVVRKALVEVEQKARVFEVNLINYKTNKAWKKAALEAYQGALKDYRRGGVSSTQVVPLQKAKEGASISFIGTEIQLYQSYYDYLLAAGKDVKEYLK